MATTTTVKQVRFQPTDYWPLSVLQKIVCKGSLYPFLGHFHCSQPRFFQECSIAETNHMIANHAQGEEVT